VFPGRIDISKLFIMKIIIIGGGFGGVNLALGLATTIIFSHH